MKKVLYLVLFSALLLIIRTQVKPVKNSIHYAALRGNVDEVRNFLKSGVWIDVKDNKGWTPLHYAAASGQNDVVRFLVDKKVNIDARDSERETPLHKAAQWGHEKTVDLLLSYGAQVNVQDNRGKNPLHQAGNVNIIDNLIKYGANIRDRDYQGRTALHAAASYNREEAVKELIKLGADISARDMQGKKASESVGSKSKGVQKAKQIKSYLNKQELLSQQLHDAARDENIEGVKNALNSGASVNSSDRTGNTILHTAVQSGNIELVNYLLGVPGIRVRIQNDEGNMPIKDAANKPEIMDVFKKKFSAKRD